MRRIFQYFTIFSIIATGAGAMTRDAQLTNTTGYNYNYMYPYMNNQMRTDLNPGVTTSQSLSPINTVVKTTKLGADRRVVPRRARSATNTNMASRTGAGNGAQSATTSDTRRVVARSASNINARRMTNPANRRVVARAGINQNGGMRTGARAVNTANNRTEPNIRNTIPTERTSSTRCLADYMECMDRYCEREDTAYNRCYCSSKLSQIDSVYQSEIDRLVKQIILLQGTNKWTDAEMNEYWMDTVGKYSGDNSWINIDDALNINWAGMESRVRGQNAFATGHEYCVQHLRGCYYMASNLRDAYRSEIARDCNTYEQSLQKLKNAAESIIGAYK
ncbi:MAG: hypothetical protein IJY99_04005 [Alphaproteobacteria bacterium]|nr:hypothetical protein [Alphaproteobacteria bacterium]